MTILGYVALRLDPVVQVPNVLLQVLPVGLPLTPSTPGAAFGLITR
jgi:hypothetical protein